MILSVTLKTTAGMPSNMLEKWHYAQLILAIFDVACVASVSVRFRRKNKERESKTATKPLKKFCT